jgi:hypothetical protein
MVDNLPPPNAEVKNEWSCTCTPPKCLHVGDSDIFTFHLQECNPKVEFRRLVNVL